MTQGVNRYVNITHTPFCTHVSNDYGSCNDLLGDPTSHYESLSFCDLGVSKACVSIFAFPIGTQTFHSLNKFNTLIIHPTNNFLHIFHFTPIFFHTHHISQEQVDFQLKKMNITKESKRLILYCTSILRDIKCKA